MRKARVAIAGCGKAAEHYVSHLRQSQAVDLVAVSDPVADRAEHFAHTYAIEYAFQDADEMLGALDFDLLVNLTPMLLHASVNRKALEAGRNVWCEKPIATDLAEAQALLFLAQRQGVGLWSAPAHYISSSFQFMASMLMAGSIGRPSAAHGIIGSS
ncbi:MAG: Gfo/Idh/MocA family oxidoreductase, partial [Ktedonobacteraceae bacterium]|nr:Gfo/Idh/MocA family oxidoreductase [Ktedonobacteraceae bacterium]